MSALANRPVLVLNRNWQPINVASLEDALKKVTGETGDGMPKARIIDPADYSVWTWEMWSQLKPRNKKEIIRGVQQDYRMPKVILVSYDRLPNQRVKFSRRMIYRRDNQQCQYCGKNFPTEELNMDHIVPRSQGGPTTWTNVCLSCISCNSRKANRTPEQAGMKLIRQPFKPKFTLFKERRYIDPDWRKFLSEMYWEVPLENDEPDD